MTETVQQGASPLPEKPMPIRKRLAVLTLAGGIGGLFLIPYVLIARPDIHPAYVWLGLPLGSLVVSGLCAWAGLKFADRAGLAMPYLRPWELGQRGDRAERGWLIRVSVATGGIFGLAGTIAYHLAGLPPHPGTFAVRVSTFPFAALVPEIVAHLFVMSGLVLALKRTWISILLSGVVFVLLFHGGQIVAGPVPAFVWAFDYLFGVMTGWIYSRYGIEGAALTHAVAHAILFGMI
ncbi:MAG TPA: hypothetical protein VNJ12_11655 [Candidatus Dormibacteraeota bacterium]|nr:hypothetical protein [Candidatus Dormibacteraeota bacterium]